MSARRTHPVTIIAFLWKYAYWLLLPLARGLYAMLIGDFFSWATGALLDVVVLAGMVAAAYLRWFFLRYAVTEDGFYYTTGVLSIVDGMTPLCRVCAVTGTARLLARLCGVCYVSVDTAALPHGKSDLAFYVHKKEAERLLSLLDCDEEKPAQVKAKPGALLLLSLLTSNSFLGIVLGATFVSQAGKLLGENLTGRLLGYLTYLSEQLQAGVDEINGLLRIAYRLPLLGALVALVLVLGWSVAFLISVEQNFGLTVQRRQNLLHVTSGLLTKRRTVVQVSAITYLDVRQSVVTRWLSLYSVYLHAQGIDQSPLGKLALLPFSDKQAYRTQLGCLLPDMLPVPREVVPDKKGAVWGYIFMPLTILVCLIPAAWLLIWLFPHWREMLLFVAGATGFVAAWFLTVRAVTYRSAGLGHTNDRIVLRYCEGMSLHTVVIPRRQLLCVQTFQHPLQLLSGRCDAIFYAKGERQKGHWVRNLPLTEVEQFCAAIRLPNTAPDLFPQEMQKNGGSLKKVLALGRKLW